MNDTKKSCKTCPNAKSCASNRTAPKGGVESLEQRLLFSANAITIENALAGRPESQWMVDGDGDASIQGFSTDISVDQGGTVFFKIDDKAKAAYRLEIHRLGYYQGNGARLVATIASSQNLKIAQPAPLTNATTGLVDCGNWSVTSQWTVPANATSGLYVANIVREDTGGESQIFFVVRDDDGHSDVLFQTADTTWAAYNSYTFSTGQYGGNSLYTGTSTAALGQGYNRAVAVSYNRPLMIGGSHGGGGTYNHPLFAEYPMIRFLEANGYSVSYSTGVDTDRRGAELLEHKLFLSVGHDEYWSGAQRTAVDAARDAGVNLAFFSGNEMYWKVRWENSTDASGTPYRTMVCYKDTHAMADTDPTSTWTGQWRDPRFFNTEAGLPENEITGQMFAVNRDTVDIGTAMQVPAEYGKMRLWRNTSVANLTAGQVATLANGTLGYEWDEDVDNGFRPAGMINLSYTYRLVPEKLVDTYSGYGAPCPNCTGIGAACGCIVGQDYATHTLTMYRMASGAIVFGAGTVQWSWGLDSHHLDAADISGGAQSDVRMQQATINLFADMGVQPATIMATLTAATMTTDFIPPTVTISSPVNGSTVALGTVLTISGTATDTGGGKIAGVEVSVDGGQTWRKATGRATWQYVWTPPIGGAYNIRVRATDDSLNTQSVMAVANITVTGPTGQTVFGDQVPADYADTDGVPIELGMKFQADVAGTVSGVRFYKFAANTGTHIGSLWTSSGVKLATVTFTNESTTGWQVATFSTPVNIQANTTYVVSYFTTKGHYASDEFYFTSSRNMGKGLVHALKDGVQGVNGLYDYNASSIFPTDSYQGSNFYVDVVFNPAGPDLTPPALVSQTPSPGSNTAASMTTVQAAFNESINVNTLSFVLKNSSNQVVAATVAYDANTRTSTLTPTSQLGLSASYSATISASDMAGNAMSPVTWSFTTSATNNFSLWASATTPAGVDSDTAKVEVGTKFQSSISGYVTAIRFYKGSANTGTHIGHLWTSSGTLLATVTFSGETTSGWQQMNLSTPVAITANTQYVVSYYAPVGRYSVNAQYFGSGYSNSPLSTPAAAGVYAYVNGGGFPNQAYQNENYWVDVLFTTSLTDTTPPTIIARTPAVSATDVPTSTTVTATFNEDINVGTLSLVLRNPANQVIASGVSYNAATRVATLTPNAALALNTVYTATLSASDTVGNAMSPVVWSFTTTPGDVTPPTITTRTPASGATGVALNSTVTATFSEAINLPTLSFLLRDASNQVVAANVAYDAVTRTATLTPSALLAATSTYTATVSVSDTSGNAMSATSWSFTTLTPDLTPPSITNRTPASGATGVAVSTAVTATFSEAINEATLSLVLRNAANQVIASTVTYNPATQVATLTPLAPLAISTTYTATISASDTSGNAMSATSWSFTTTNTALTNYSLWAPDAVPAATDSDTAQVEIGMTFQASVAGFVSAIRFHKATVNTGTHVGHLWSSTGTLLATVTFTGETASGWQQMNLSSPVAINANTQYVVSYYAPGGRYSVTSQGFSSGTTNGPLSTQTGAGVYLYGANGGFPTNVYQNENYWVDVVFQTSGYVDLPPVLTAQTPAANATNISRTANITATFNEAINVSSLVFELRGPGGVLVAAAVSYNATTRVATLNPTPTLASVTAYTVTISAMDLAGNLMSPVTWTFTTRT